MQNYNINNKKNYNKNNNNAKVYPIPAPNATAVPVPGPKIPVADDVKALPKKISESNVKELKSQGYTDGLIQSINNNLDAFPLRIWVIDNSGSMNMLDGHKLYQMEDNRIVLFDCSRWSEIQDTVTYHANAAAMLEAPTSFRLLNPVHGLKEFSVAERPNYIQDDLKSTLRNIRQISPSGVTPLSERVMEISSYVHSIKHELEAMGQKIVVVLATDGRPSDRNGNTSQYTLNEFKNAMRSLEGLPVWLVIRLCTDDEATVDYYNEIDAHLEMSCDVLDDYFAEALEVYEHNSWLTYGLPLHRMREMGFYHKLFDLIDERPLTHDELTDFFLLLYGADALDGIPDPQLEWPLFIERIASVTKAQQLQFNPVRKRMMPWVDIAKLDFKYGNHPLCNCFALELPLEL